MPRGTKWRKPLTGPTNCDDGPVALQFADEHLLERLAAVKVNSPAMASLESLVVIEGAKIQDGRSGVTTTDFGCTR
jgi:hypothetical protein